MTDYERIAREAVAAWHNGRRYRDFPGPGQVGLCGMAVRALWEAVEKKPAFFRAGSALLMERANIRAGKSLTRAGGNSPWHTAVWTHRLRVGSQIYMPYGAFGHVVTVIRVAPHIAAENLRPHHVTVFENTIAYRSTFPAGSRRGTIITTLDKVLGPQGVARITSIANP